MDWVDSYIVFMCWLVFYFYIVVVVGLILWFVVVVLGFVEFVFVGYCVILVQIDVLFENVQFENVLFEDDLLQDVFDDQVLFDEVLIEFVVFFEFIVEVCLCECEDLDVLFVELVEFEGEVWLCVEIDILCIWLCFGLVSMDMLLKCGEVVLDVGDIGSVIGYLMVLIDYVFDFVGGWYLCGVVFYLQGDYGVVIVDMVEMLKFELCYFGVLIQFGVMFEELGDNDCVLDVYCVSLKIYFYQQDVVDVVMWLEV